MGMTDRLTNYPMFKKSDSFGLVFFPQSSRNLFLCCIDYCCFCFIQRADARNMAFWHQKEISAVGNLPESCNNPKISHFTDHALFELRCIIAERTTFVHEQPSHILLQSISANKVCQKNVIITSNVTCR